MASPFSIFRKNQRASMAILVVLSIIAFVIAPALQQMMGASFGAAGSGQLVVTWDGGALSMAEAQKLQQTRGLAVNFFKRLAAEVQKTGKEPNVPGFNSDGNTPFSLGINAQTDMRSVVRTRILQEYARQQQIEFDDDAAKQFLKAYVNNSLTNDAIKQIKEDATGGRLSNFDLYRFIKMELAALAAERIGNSGMSGPARADVAGAGALSTDIIGGIPISTAADRWQMFVKFNQRAKIKAFPVLVDDFLDQVDGQPTESELSELYEEGKDRTPSKFSPLPGFRKPYQGVLEYVGASLDSFIDAEIAKLSDEEIQSEYDRLIAEGRYQVPAEESNESPENVDEEPSDASNTPPVPPTTNEESSTNDSGATNSSSNSEQSDDSTGSEEPPEEKSPAKPASNENEEQSGLSDESNEGKPGEGSDGDKPAPEGADQSINETAPVGRLVRFQENNSTQAESPSQESPSQTADTGESTSTDSPMITDEEESSIEIEPSTTDGDSQSEAAPNSPKMRTQTLDEVRDELTRSMVIDSARSKLNESIAAVRLAMNDYYEERSIAEQEKVNDDSVSLPRRPDLPALAAENSLEYKRTELVDTESVESYEIGKAFLTESLRNQQFQKVPLMLQPGVPLYIVQEAFLSQEGVTSTYVLWKSEESPSRVEELTDVREQVELAWKRQQAKKLAMNKAEALAAQAREVGESPWSAVISEQETELILNPPSFTWLTPSGGFQGGITISTVDGIPDIGNAFMESIFAASKGDWNVISDAYENQYYVFELVEKIPDDSSLKGRFSAAPVAFGGNEMTSFKTQSAFNSWFSKVQDNLNVKWNDESILLQ